MHCATLLLMFSETMVLLSAANCECNDVTWEWLLFHKHWWTCPCHQQHIVML